MCQIIVHFGGDQLEADLLSDSWFANSDGAGYMFIRKGGVVSRKFVGLNDFINNYEKDSGENPNSPFVVHTRLATHGIPGTFNVHPFPMDRHTKVAHNGILNVLMDKDEHRSDTQVFVKEYMSKLPRGWLDDACLVDLVQDFAKGSKLVALTTDPALKDTVYILNEKDGSWDGDRWYSNRSDKWTVNYRTMPKYPLVRQGQIIGTPEVDETLTSHRTASAGALLPSDDEVFICPKCFTAPDWDLICFSCEYCVAHDEDIWDCECYEKAGFVNAYTDHSQRAWG